MMKKSSRIFITNSDSLLGRGFERILSGKGYRNLISRPPVRFDPLDQKSVLKFFRKYNPEYVLLLPEKTGGIKANIERPAEFFYDNLQAQTNIMHASWKTNVNKLLYVGSSCAYPKNCLQPMKEEYLLTGPLEETSEPYSIAKIAGIKMCQYYNRQYHTAFIP